MAIPTAAQRATYQNLTGNNLAGNTPATKDNFTLNSHPQTNNTNIYLSKIDTINSDVSSASVNAGLAKDYLNLIIQAKDQARTYADQAAASATSALNARDAAVLSKGVFPNVAAGLANTGNGDYFSVPSNDNTQYLVLYQRYSPTGATTIQTYPSIAGVEYTVENTLYVSANGSNSNSGTSWKQAFRRIERALEVATDRWNTYGKSTLIEWAPETPYYTNGHLDMPDNCVIKAVHRTVFVRPNPGYEQRNVFRMGSGCFIEGVMFEGWQVDSLDNPTEGFAVSFRPGAVITRVPYAHKIAVRALPTWGKIAPPLDATTGNPYVPRAGGVCLADGNIISQYSIFPNIMTWGATPVLPNGIGYCAKNGALINAVNAVSIWAHKHFFAQSGGQIILSACSTQFGDYSLVADGGRQLVNPPKAYSGTNILTSMPKFTDANDLNAIAQLIDPDKQNQLVDSMWDKLYNTSGFANKWDSILQAKTKSDSKLLLQCLYWALISNNEQPMLDFAKGMFDVTAKPIYISAARCGLTINDSTSLATRDFVTQLKASHDSIINTMWTALQTRGYELTWTDVDEAYTRRDAGTLLVALEKTLIYSNEQYMFDFVRGLYNTDGSLVIDYQKMPAVLYSWDTMRTSILALSSIGGATSVAYLTVNALFTALISNFKFKSGVTISSQVSRSAAYDKVNYYPVITGDTIWSSIVNEGLNTLYLNDSYDHDYTVRDGNNLIAAIQQAYYDTSDSPITVFGYGLYSFFGTSVIASNKMPAVLYSFDQIRDFTNIYLTDGNAKNAISNVIAALKENVVIKRTSTFPTDAVAAAKLDPRGLYGPANVKATLDSLWTTLPNFVAGWNLINSNPEDKKFTYRDGTLFLQALADCLYKGSDQPMVDFGNQLTISFGIYAISPQKMPITLFAFETLRDLSIAKIGNLYSAQITALVSNLKDNLTCSKNVLPAISDLAKTRLKDSVAIIKANESAIVESTWTALTQNSQVFATGKLTMSDMALTKRDTLTLLGALESMLNTYSEKPLLNFASGMFEPARVPVINGSKIIPTVYAFQTLKLKLGELDPSTNSTSTMLQNLIDNATLNSNKYAFVYCWDYIKKYIKNNTISSGSNTLKGVADTLLDNMQKTVLNPSTITEPSRITAIGHTWTAVMSGVALTKVPPANNGATIQDSIIESDNGIVIASGQDDQGNALFVGGLQINSDTGELGGPPFDQAVRRVATKTSISRSF